jgi:MerR family transcriptional regulator, aldehyde-responsive regulator
VPHDDQVDLSIGQLSAMTGLGVHALRYYEKIGLIAPVPRLGSGHRRYSPQTVERVESLSYLRATGLGVDGMRRYIRNLDRGDDAASDHAALLTTHAEKINDQIQALQVRRDYIRAKAAYWRAVADGRGDDPEARRSIQRARDLARELT